MGKCRVESLMFITVLSSGHLMLNNSLIQQVQSKIVYQNSVLPKQIEALL